MVHLLVVQLISTMVLTAFLIRLCIKIVPLVDMGIGQASSCRMGLVEINTNVLIKQHAEPV